MPLQGLPADNMGLFGSSGIRGLIGNDIDAELGVRMAGRSAVFPERSWWERTLGPAVTYLLTPSSPGSSRPAPSLTGGNGAHADLGMRGVPFRLRPHGDRLPQPPEYNGVKMWNQDGSAFDGDQTEEVERLIAEGGRKAGWEEMFEERAWTGAIDEHILTIMEEVGQLERTLVLDCGCGATGPVSPDCSGTLDARR